MSKRESETSLMKPADAVSAFAHHTPGTVAAGFSGLEKGVDVSARNPDYFPPAAEESTVPPVASGGMSALGQELFLMNAKENMSELGYKNLLEVLEREGLR